MHYERIHSSELQSAKSKEEDVGGNEWLRKKPWRRVFWFLVINIAAVLASVGALDLFLRSIQASERSEEQVKTVHDCFRLCGYTAADAIKRGCQFEEFDFRWEHPRCVDRELTAEYRRMTSEDGGLWLYEVDDETGPEEAAITESVAKETRRRSINATELGMLVAPGRVVYATMRHQLAHCMFRWRKQFRAPFWGTRWPSQLGWEEDHIKDCADIIMNKRDVPLQNYTVKVVFPSP
ncbi:hypothetical protein PspLS_01683 [Pyricularia sp. CBS 133598]|nr:hypothetical protein PspLS_01683 [Pyricularia sp. CBS 133598]